MSYYLWSYGLMAAGVAAIVVECLVLNIATARRTRRIRAERKARERA